MANKSLRCLRADGDISTKNKKTTAEVLSVMGRYELMDLLRAKRGGELNHVMPDTVYVCVCVYVCLYILNIMCAAMSQGLCSIF